MTKKIVLSILLALSIAGLLVLGNVATVRAKSGCSDATLQGSYGIRATGNILPIPGGPPATPVAIVGVITFDGMGQLTAELTQRLIPAGATTPTSLIKVPYIGNYSVNADCSVEDVWHNLSNGTSSIHESVIVDHGRGFFIINTTTGPSVVSGEARKQFPGGADRD